LVSRIVSVSESISEREAFEQGLELFDGSHDLSRTKWLASVHPVGKVHLS